MLALNAWIAIAATATVFVVLQLRRGIPTDLVFIGAAAGLTLIGVLRPERAIQGFTSDAVITIGGLLAVTAGLRITGVLDWVGELVLGSSKTDGSAIRRLALFIVSISAFVLNTALVAMMLPVVVDWCRRRQISTSKLLIPLSYLTILGGVCTLVGTSTTLIVNSHLRDAYTSRQQQLAEQRAQQARFDAAAGDSAAATADSAPPLSPEELARLARFNEGVRPMTLFEIGKVGLPIALLGAAFLVVSARFLMPDRREMIEMLDEQRREYLVEMRVSADCSLIGQSVESAGLRHLPGLFLIEIDRDGEVITPVTPSDVIQQGDLLVFTGVVSTIVDLEKFPGLIPSTDLTYEIHPQIRRGRYLAEAVLSRSSPLIGRTLRAANFRERYDAAVVAVHRNGVRLATKIGDIKLEPGDTLLLQTRNDFVSLHRNNQDFYLVSPVDGYMPRRHERSYVAAILGLLLVAWLCASNWLKSAGVQGLGSPPIAALSIVVLLVFTRCMSTAQARNAIDLQVILTIVGALALGRALEDSGAARDIANLIVNQAGHNPRLLLLCVYLMASIFTELITNNAVAAILLPVVINVAEVAGLQPRPFVMAVALAASLPFLTPIGYQTNLMVMGPGGYQPRDYLRAGVPLALIALVTAQILIPLVWSF